MAVRSGAGTGVVVSLVVFILTTVFLLVLAIVFYAGKTKAIEAQAASDSTMATYIRDTERNNDAFKAYEDSAKSRNKSVVMLLHEQMQEVMQYVDGAPNTNVDELRTNFSGLGVEQDETIRNSLRGARQSLGDRQDEVDRLNLQLKTWSDENAELQAQLEALRRSSREEVDAIQGQIDEYRKAAEDYRTEIDDTIRRLQESQDRITQGYEQEIDDLQNEVDGLGEERVLLIQRINQLESKVRQTRLLPQDPSLLVDARVLDTTGSSNDQVFIDRGREHHIVLGMTFEVYDDDAALQQVDRMTGALPRGKASVQVIKVGQTTSTCKIVRWVAGRPVVRGNVLANAVYDPSYRFKFLVHGKFDLDGDGRPTEAEA
jgi:uncharacterized coiled-coil DUF342 family protein